MYIYQPRLPTQIWRQNEFCCHAFCNDPTCTHPLCSNFFHVGLCWEGLHPCYRAAVVLGQVWSQLSACRLFFNKYFLALGWFLLYLFTDVYIYQPLLLTQIWTQNEICCIFFLAMIRLKLIHFVAGFFMLVCFGGVWVCSRFILQHCS